MQKNVKMFGSIEVRQEVTQWAVILSDIFMTEHEKAVVVPK